MALLHRHIWAPILALLTLATLIYWPGLSGDFLFDDFPNIVTNSRVHAQSLTWQALKDAATAYQPGSYGRPLATISFAMDYLISGKDAWSYKVTSLIVHLINTLLVYWLLRRLLTLPRSNFGNAPLAAFGIALIWAIHPLQVSSVLYIVQRMETLATTFVFLALIAYLRGRTAQIDGGRGWHWICAAIGLTGLGMLSKETAILTPAYALALELTVLRFDARHARTQRTLAAGYGIATAVALVVFFAYVLPAALAPDAFAGRTFNLYERLLTQLRVLPMYLGQMALPLPGSLTFFYDNYPKSTGWLSPATTLAGAALLLGLAGAAWILRKSMPLFSLGVFWFFAAHLLTSSVFNVELVFEHRNYFALLGALLAATDLLRRIPLRNGPAIGQLAVLSIVLGFGLLTAIRSAVWGNPLHLAMDLAERNPTSPRASSDLATLYVAMSGSDPSSPYFTKALAEFERASRLPDASPLPEQGLILMTATTGLPVKDEWWDRFIHKVRTRPISPQELMAVTGLMTQRYEGIELDDQRLSEAYSALLERGPMPAPMYARYGDYALTYLRDEALADQMFVAAVERSSTDAAYATQLFAMLVADGHQRQANAVFARASELGLMATGTR